MCRLAYSFILVSFLASTVNLSVLKASEIMLPAPGTMVHLSPAFNPPILKGIKVHPENPFRFDFILDKGSEMSAVARAKEDSLKQESTKLIKYFLAALTTPEKDMWVNLSPYEKDRIVPESFGQTEMGRDLLAQDYLLKQITASLVYPEGDIGKAFWKKVYEASANKNITINTFNKVWIVPQKAVVYENVAQGTAYVVESSLKVMTEQDYLADTKNRNNKSNNQAIRDIVIPQLTKEINAGKNFAQLRQVYNSLILATWYKKKIRNSILSQVYADKNKVAGINIDDPLEKLRIYDQYLQAFKKGVYNYIKDEQDPVTQQMTPRKYFSGGMHMNMDTMSTVHVMPNSFTDSNQAMLVQVSIAPEGARVNEAIDQPKDPKVLALIDSINVSIHEKGILEMQSIDYDDPLYVQVRNIIAVANNHAFHAGDEYRSGMAEAVYRVVQYLKSRNDLTKLDFEQISRFLLLKRVIIAGKLAEKGNSDEIGLISGVGDSNGWMLRSLGRFGSPQSISFASSKGYPELYQKLMRKKNEFELSKKGMVTYRKTYTFGVTRTKYDQIIEVDNDFLEFKIYHADPDSLPLILFHLQDLWMEILSNSDPDKRDRLIAEMEWWFYQANPYIRAGASIGYPLSLIAQSLTGRILDDRFEHHDWDALSSTLEEYIVLRSNQFHQLRQMQADTNPATKTGKTGDSAQVSQDPAMRQTIGAIANSSFEGYEIEILQGALRRLDPTDVSRKVLENAMEGVDARETSRVKQLLQKVKRRVLVISNLRKEIRQRLNVTIVLASKGLPTYATVLYRGEFWDPIIVINADLTKRMTDEQLMWVLGHELGHVWLSDVEYTYEQTRNPELTLLIEDRADMIGMLAVREEFPYFEINALRSIWTIFKEFEPAVDMAQRLYPGWKDDEAFDPHRSMDDRREFLEKLFSTRDDTLKNLLYDWPESIIEEPELIERLKAISDTKRKIGDSAQITQDAAMQQPNGEVTSDFRGRNRAMLSPEQKEMNQLKGQFQLWYKNSVVFEGLIRQAIDHLKRNELDQFESLIPQLTKTNGVVETLSKWIEKSSFEWIEQRTFSDIISQNIISGISHDTTKALHFSVYQFFNEETLVNQLEEIKTTKEKIKDRILNYEEFLIVLQIGISNAKPYLSLIENPFVQLQKIDIKSIVEEAVRQFKEEAKQKGLSLEVDMENEKYIAESIEPSFLRIILNNLIGNAVKYTKSGEIIVRLKNERLYLVIEIKDTGIGIPESDQEAMRYGDIVRASNVGNISGSGVGMQLIRTAVNLMNGHLDFDSIENKGSTFKVLLPRYIVKTEDNAQIVEDKSDLKRGGIDFSTNGESTADGNAKNLNLQIRNTGQDIKFHMDPAMIKQLQDSHGFTPVIIDIQPMTDLPKFLGIKMSGLLVKP